MGMNMQNPNPKKPPQNINMPDSVQNFPQDKVK